MLACIPGAAMVRRVSIDVPALRFAPAGGARLAYQVWGDGPATIVAIPPLAQNIEAAWGWPNVHAMLERFGRFGRWMSDPIRTRRPSATGRGPRLSPNR